jgi:hypothetical protein
MADEDEYFVVLLNYFERLIALFLYDAACGDTSGSFILSVKWSTILISRLRTADFPSLTSPTLQLFMRMITRMIMKVNNGLVLSVSITYVRQLLHQC